MVVDLVQRDFQADEFKNRGSRLPHPPTWPPINIPKGKRSNRRMRIFLVDATLDVKERQQMQAELNEGKNPEECILIRSEILENPSESEIEAAAGLLDLSKQMPYFDATNEDKAIASFILDFSRQGVYPKWPYSAVGDEENGGREKKKMKAKKEKTSVLHGPDPPLELPANFRERIEEKKGSDLVLVIQKKIFDSDVNYGLNRLSIPESKVKNEFLSVEEKALLLLKDEKGKNKHLELVMIGPSSPQDEYRINLVKWEMKKGGGKKSSWTYNLVTTWNTVVKQNNLQPNMIVQIWSFRVNSKLNFALVIC